MSSGLAVNLDVAPATFDATYSDLLQNHINHVPRTQAEANLRVVGQWGNWVDDTLRSMQQRLQEMSVEGVVHVADARIVHVTASPEGSVTAEPGSMAIQDNGTWWRKASGSGPTGWVEIVSVSGSGVDNRIVRWDGTSAFQSSNATLDDSGNLSGIGTLGVAGAATFSSTVGITGALTATGLVTAGDGLTVTAGAVSLPNDSISYAELQNVSAEARILGRAAGAGAGDVTELTAAQVAAIIGATLDHGALAGLGDDDHTQYLLADGSRAGATSGAQTLTRGLRVGDGTTTLDYIATNQSGGATASHFVMQHAGSNIWRFRTTSSGSFLLTNTAGANPFSFTQGGDATFTNTVNFTGTIAGTGGTITTADRIRCTGGGVYVGSTTSACVIVDTTLTQPAFNINKQAGANRTILDLFDATAGRQWIVQNSSSGAFNILRYVAGVPTDTPFSISNSTGQLTLANQLNGTSAVFSSTLQATQGRFTTSGASGVFGTAPSVGSIIPSVGGTADDYLQLGTTTAGSTEAVSVYVIDGSRNSRAGMYLSDAVSGSGAWGHWLTWSSAGAQPYVLGAGGTEWLRISTSGNAGFSGTLSVGNVVSPVSGARLVSVGSTWQLMLADNTTDATPKIGHVAVPHYTNTEEPVTLLRLAVTSGANTLNIGGSHSLSNAATQISLYTAADSTTETGTERLRVDSAGITTLYGNAVLSSGPASLRVGDGTGSPSQSIRKSEVGAGSIRFETSLGTLRSRIVHDGDEDLVIEQWDGTPTLVASTYYRNATGVWDFPSYTTAAQQASDPTPGAGRGAFYSRSSDGAPMHAYGATPVVSELLTVDADGVSSHSDTETIVTRVQTTDATPTDCGSYTIPSDDQAAIVVAQIIGIQNDGGEQIVGMVRGGYYRNGGGATIIGSLNNEWSDASAGATSGSWAFSMYVTGNDVRVAVVGAAATTINWCARIVAVPT